MEKAVTIRMPSTANLMIDSADRNTTNWPSAWDFQIQKNQSIQNGFFTRVGATEVVLEWCEPNISSGEVIFDVSGAATRANVDVNIGQGNYTMEDLMNAVVDTYNSDGTRPAGTSISATNDGLGWGFDISGGFFQGVASPLGSQMGLDIGGGLAKRVTINGCTDLREYRYLDIVSPQLTYAQDLKDNSTQNINRDVLVRWYMAEDVPENLDGYGFPILMGYKPFVRRRLYNPPKQIKWDANLPIGNLSFQVYDDDGNQLPKSDDASQFLMTLQLSEN
jgi:hypothetical protein